MVYITASAYLIICLLLYFVARQNLQQVYRLLYRLTHSDYMAKVLISMWYLIGTFVHELSHFFVALLLGHTVKSFSILPIFENGGIKLGSVVYYKKDRLRSILVGIAPIFGGTLVAYGLYLFLATYSSTWWIAGLLMYLLFVVLTNMFSSSQDLQDAIYLIPLSTLIVIIGYIVGFDPVWFAGTDAAVFLTGFFKTMTLIGSGAFLVHLTMWIGIEWLLRRRGYHN